jgi:hypothetical protein
VDPSAKQAGLPASLPKATNGWRHLRGQGCARNVPFRRETCRDERSGARREWSELGYCTASARLRAREAYAARA